MRRVIDDSKLSLANDRIATALYKLKPEAVTRYEYGTDRIQVSLIKKYILNNIGNDFIFGDTKHAHGIGNNNAIEVIYTGDPKEQQICGYINLIDNMYGSVICYLTDIDGNIVCRYGKLTTFGWRE